MHATGAAVAAEAEAEAEAARACGCRRTSVVRPLGFLVRRNQGRKVSARLVHTRMYCTNCANALTLVEMHYLSDDNGGATCERCEYEWHLERLARRVEEPTPLAAPHSLKRLLC
jgi:hypothetical protein